MAGDEIVVLGGGFGGAAAALTARRLLGDESRVILVDRSPITRLCGANPLIAVGERAPGAAIRSLDGIARAGVDVLRAEISAIDLDSAAVVTDSATLRFSHLVVALGAVYDWDAVPGSVDAHTFYHHEGAARLAERLGRLDRGRVAVAVAGSPVKCPPASIEAILLIEDWARRKGIRHRVDLHLTIPEPAPLPVAGAEASQRLTELLGQRGVALHTGATLTEVAAGGSRARFADGTSLEADVLVVVPVHRVPPVVESSGLTAGQAWVPVDPATLETSIERIFAIGDVNLVPTGEKTAVPKAGVFASGQGQAVAAVIAARVAGSETPPPYAGHGACLMAVSLTEAAAVGGTFLGAGGPVVGLGPASTRTMADMVRWERDWQAYRV